MAVGEDLERLPASVTEALGLGIKGFIGFKGFRGFICCMGFIGVIGFVGFIGFAGVWGFGLGSSYTPKKKGYEHPSVLPPFAKFSDTYRRKWLLPATQPSLAQPYEQP